MMNSHVNPTLSLFGILLLTVAASAAEPGLVGWWRLDDGAGTTAVDSSDGGHNGSFVTGVPAWAAGKFGGALKFSGGAQVEIPDHADFHFEDAVTIALWANPEAEQQTDSKLFCKQKSTYYPYAIQYDSSGKTIYANVSSASAQFNTKPNLANFPGEWAHLCCTYDGSAVILYKDGVEVARVAGSGKIRQNTLSITIGGRLTYTTSNTFKGMIDDVRLYSRALTPQEIAKIMKGPETAAASKPNPGLGAVEVSRDVVLSWKPVAPGMLHDVYFGSLAADVSGADRANPKEVLVGRAQDANTYDPAGLLALGQTYYWRVDEVNTVTNTISKGPVWSFATEPLAYPVKPVAVTASSVQSPDNGPEKTIDSSGLNADDQHATLDTTMWISTLDAPQPAWIRYDLGQLYKLHQMWVWNSNQPSEPTVGFGAKAVAVEYSSDGNTWTILAGISQFARATGKADYTHNTTVDFGGVTARYVKITIQSNWGGIVSQYSLSEVRFLYKPVEASNPEPTAGQAGVTPDVTLRWRAGREAATHQIYFGTDPNALAPAGTTAEASFVPPAVNLGTTYYWRVDEVNAAETPSLWTGKVWSFSTQEYRALDDFESYNDTTNNIFDTWLDDFDPKAPVQYGALVGNEKSANGTYGETTINLIHGGKQSMPLAYNNTGPNYVVSEAVRTWSSAQDWTAYGADTLSLWFRGQPTGFLALASDHILMSGVGTDIFNSSDQGRFVYKQLSGNGSIIARVDRLDNTNEWAKAGVMIRESLEAGSTWAYSLASISHGVRFQARLVVGSGATSDSTLSLPASQTGAQIPMWVKVERDGSTFNAYYSSDGATWTSSPWNPQTIAMGPNVYIGLAVTSHAAGAVAQAEFSSIATTGNVTGAWQSAQLGTVVQPDGNTQDALYVTIKDNTGKSLTLKHPDAAAVTIGAWQQWEVPFDSLTGVNAGKITSLIIGVGDRTNPQRGAGKIYIDDIQVGRPAR